MDAWTIVAAVIAGLAGGGGVVAWLRVYTEDRNAYLQALQDRIAHLENHSMEQDRTIASLVEANAERLAVIGRLEGQIAGMQMLIDRSSKLENELSLILSRLIGNGSAGAEPEIPQT